MIYRFLLLLAAAVTAAGCGPELVGGSQRGEVETVMTDDPAGNPSSASHPAGVSMSRSVDPTARRAVLEGTVSANVTVALVTPGGTAIPVTGSGAAATIAIASGDQATLGSTEVEEGIYPGVRLTFTRVEVELAVPLPDPGGGSGRLSVEVDLNGGPAVVEVPVEVEVAEDETTTLRIDLNTSEWIPLADPVTGLVSRGSFSAAVSVEAEGPH